MDRSLDSLSAEFKPIAFELLARLTERGVHVLIVQTSRTLAEHLANVANGTSHVARSKHLPRLLRGLPGDGADAMDLCPFEVFQLHGPDKLQWSEADAPEAWQAIRDVAESLGLRSGARWTVPHDPGHVEYLLAGERYADIPRTAKAFADHGVDA